MHDIRSPVAAALVLGLLAGPAAAVEVTFDLAGLAGPVTSPIVVPGTDPTGALTELELQVFGLATAVGEDGEAVVAFQDLVLGSDGIGVTGPEATTEEDTPFVDAGITGDYLDAFAADAADAAVAEFLLLEPRFANGALLALDLVPRDDPSRPLQLTLFSGLSGGRVPADFTGTPEEVVAQVDALGLLGGPEPGLRGFNLLAAGEEDAFALASVTISAIPVPGAAPLLAAGLGGLWLLRRRGA